MTENELLNTLDAHELRLDTQRNRLDVQVERLEKLEERLAAIERAATCGTGPNEPCLDSPAQADVGEASAVSTDQPPFHVGQVVECVDHAKISRIIEEAVVECGSEKIFDKATRQRMADAVVEIINSDDVTLIRREIDRVLAIYGGIGELWHDEPRQRLACALAEFIGPIPDRALPPTAERESEPTPGMVAAANNIGMYCDRQGPEYKKVSEIVSVETMATVINLHLNPELAALRVENEHLRYAISQYNLCCEQFNIGKLATDDGDSLFEAMCRMEQQLDTLRAENERLKSKLADAESKAVSATEHHHFYRGKVSDYVDNEVKLNAAITTLTRERDEARKNLPDYPDADCTDAAHPAWWRGHDHAVNVFCQKVNEILDGKYGIEGIANEPWESTRLRLISLVAALTAREASESERHAIMAHLGINFDKHTRTYSVEDDNKPDSVFCTLAGAVGRVVQIDTTEKDQHREAAEAMEWLAKNPYCSIYYGFQFGSHKGWYVSGFNGVFRTPTAAILAAKAATTNTGEKK